MTDASAIERNGASPATGNGHGAFSGLHAQYHRASIDVFANGSHGSNEGMPPKPGLLVVEYLPSRMADPALARRMKDLEAQLADARARGVDNDEAALLDMEGYSGTLAEFLVKVLWSMRVHLQPYPAPPGQAPQYAYYTAADGTLTDRILIDEMGPVLMGEVMLAIQEANAGKKGSDTNTTSGSLMTPSKRTAKPRRK